MIVKMKLLDPVNDAAYDTPGAILTDRNGRYVCVWEIDEPELLRIFEQTAVAYFEAEPDGDEWKIVRRVPDQDW